MIRMEVARNISIVLRFSVSQNLKRSTIAFRQCVARLLRVLLFNRLMKCPWNEKRKNTGQSKQEKHVLDMYKYFFSLEKSTKSIGVRFPSTNDGFYLVVTTITFDIEKKRTKSMKYQTIQSYVFHPLKRSINPKSTMT